MSQNDTNKLPRNQSRAVRALLEYPTVTAAAKSIGLSRKTIYRYLENPDFRRELTKQVKTLTDSAGAALAAGQPFALNTLYSIMRDGRSEANRRLAAVAWLDFHLKYQNSEIEERLSALEERVFNEY